MKNCQKNNVIHVGLGKTGTTSLQNSVFPKMRELGIIGDYNPASVEYVLENCANLSSYSLSSKDLQVFSKLKNSFISDERMVGWNPSLWRERSEEIKGIFGSNATILITIREPKSYLRSMYQQVIHQGNIISPENFFLNSSDYKKYSKITRHRFNEVCDVDNFNYSELINLYTSLFSKVIVVPMVSINEMKFIESFSDTDTDTIKMLSEYAKSAPRKNQSYNSLAMKISLSREKALNIIGLKSFGTHDRYHRKNLTNRSKNKQPSSFKSKNTFRLFFTWRGWLQGIINHFPFTTKYQLPENIYLGKYFNQNVEFYKNIASSKDGYSVFEKTIEYTE